MQRLLLSAATIILLLPPSASAQWATWNKRVLVGINAAAQLTSSRFDDAFEFDHPFGGQRERARVTSRYEIPKGAVFDGSAVVRLAGGFGAGVAVTIASATNDLEVRGRVPHPFFFDRFRDVEGSVAARHAETGIHLLAAYVVPLTPRLHLAVSGGPSRFEVEQRVAERVTVSESYPFDTAEFADAPLETVKAGVWGFNVGADVGWMFTRNLGAGGMIRYARANVSLSPTGREAFDVDVGGMFAGGGLRVMF